MLGCFVLLLFSWVLGYNYRMKNSSSEKGFTLIELLVVIAIMATLTTIIYVSISQTRGKSRDQQRIATVHLIQLGLESFYNIKGFYPKELWPIDGLTIGLNSLPNNSPGKINLSDLTPPTGDTTHGYYYIPLMLHGSSSGCNGYHLYTILESKTSVLESRAGFDSSSLPKCYSLSISGIQASSSPLIYDVKSQ